MNLRQYILVLLVASITFATGCKKSITALDDQVETSVDTPVTIFLIGNANYNLLEWDDYDVTLPEHGTLTGAGYKRTYTPDAGFTGVDTIRFRLGVDGSYTNEAEISVYVGDLTGRIDRHAFDDYPMRACARQAGEEESATYVNEVTAIDCTGSTLLIGGTKYAWLDDVPSGCINCDFGIKLSSLDGIEDFTQLQSLSIEKGSIADLSPIAALNNLTEVQLPEVAGDQVSVFSSLNNPTLLWFASESLTTLNDVTPIVSLESLRVRNLIHPGFDITSISAGNWPNLATLSLSGEIDSLSGLASANLNAVTEFGFTAFSNTDLTGLTATALPQLETLSLYMGDEVSLQGLTGNTFTHLREFWIAGGRLQSFAELNDNTWPSLERLSLSASGDMTDLAGTENLELPSLRVLDAQGVYNLADVSALLTWDMPVVETIILTQKQNTLPCSEVARVEAQFPAADVQTDSDCLE